MEIPFGITVLAGIVVLAPLVGRAERRHATHARLTSLALALAALGFVGFIGAYALGATQATPTGRFLTGMDVGIATGLLIGVVVLQVYDQRQGSEASARR